MKKISLKNFLTHFRKNSKRVDKRFCFILGAGASKPSGIPTGGELVDIWMQELKESYTDKELKDWQKKKKISLSDLPSNYPEIYDKRFEVDTHGQARGTLKSSSYA
jgi:NAD-dependent SIR2 family protein deacetylase